MEPIVHGLEDQFGEQMAFQELDGDAPDGRAAMQAYGLRGHPAFVIVAPDGEVLWSAVGAQSEETLREQIRQHIR